MIRGLRALYLVLVLLVLLDFELLDFELLLFVLRLVPPPRLAVALFAAPRLAVVLLPLVLLLLALLPAVLLPAVLRLAAVRLVAVRFVELLEALRPVVLFELFPLFALGALRALEPALLRLRVAAAFFAEAERCAVGREPAAAPPLRPPFLAGSLFTVLPRPEPLFLPPPVILFTVAQARFSALFSETPRFS
jgi:hypothetical protein